MKRNLLLAAQILLAAVFCLQINAQDIKLKGIGHANRYDDGEQMVSTYVGWNNELGKAIFIVDNGIYAICQDEALGGMTETSSNLARVETNEKTIDIVTSQRSNVMSNLDNMCNTIAAAFKLAGAKVTHSDGCPAWKMRQNSELQRIVKYTYHKLFQKDPVIRGIHAGLECGLFAERYPNLDMVSMGPTLRDVHTPDERLLIPTVEMVWDHLLLTLKNIPHQS